MLLPWVRKKLLANPHRLGRWGQNKAETFLKRQRLRTLARNFSFSGGELDLVMGDKNGTIVFVEVKTRRDEKIHARTGRGDRQKTTTHYPNRKVLSETAKDLRPAVSIRHCHRYPRQRGQPRRSNIIPTHL